MGSREERRCTGAAGKGKHTSPCGRCVVVPPGFTHGFWVCYTVSQKETHMPKCKTCGKQKLQSDFHIALTTPQKTFYRRSCKDCLIPQKKAQRQRRIDNYQLLKAGLECRNCGTKDHRVLEFHHADKSHKDYTIAEKAASFSLERLKKEIDKCICLCANCHRILHYEEKQPVA